tara:strand:+ start:544 stop:1194 length:651 start_codon:yes stop_codon:yes gene_type:complete
MVTVSQVVKRIINSQPKLQDSMIEGIISFANLAEYLQPRIEKELGEEINTSSIVMALRRYSDTLQSKVVTQPFKTSQEIILKTNLCDICIVKTSTAIQKIQKLYKLIDYDRGETLNIIQGNYEITIVISQKHLEGAKRIIRGEKILHLEKNLVSLTLRLSKDFLLTPGIMSVATRKLAWENINILENISTMTELAFIIPEKDSAKAYNLFQEIIAY